MTGLYILGGGFSEDRLQKRKLILGSLLVLMGSCIRFGIVPALIVIFIGSSVILIMLQIMQRKRVNIKKILKNGMLFLLICMMVYVVRNIGLNLFSHDPEWGNYKEYNIYKKELQDYGWPGYKEYREEYKKLGVSSNDYNLWKGRDYGDSNILTIDLMKKICEIKEEEGMEKYIKNIGGYLKKYPLNFIKVNMVFPIVILFILIAFSDIKGKGYIYRYIGNYAAVRVLSVL